MPDERKPLDLGLGWNARVDRDGGARTLDNVQSRMLPPLGVLPLLHTSVTFNENEASGYWQKRLVCVLGIGRRRAEKGKERERIELYGTGYKTETQSNPIQSTIKSNSPLRQRSVKVLARGIREACDAEKARLTVVARSMIRDNRVPHDLGPAVRSLHLGSCGEAAGDDHASQGARRRGREGARREALGGRCGAEDGADGGNHDGSLEGRRIEWIEKGY